MHCTLSCMIRRQAGDEYWLISQHDHAVLSGEMARNIGGSAPAAPSGEPAILGIGLHDCGWPLHDDAPTINGNGAPLDVFESPRQITLPVWTRSAELATEQDPYAGLLVSLHVLSLSTFATQQQGLASRTWNLDDPRVRFEVNVFQHRMIEIQEDLRRRLGLSTDQPLKNGLAQNPTDAKEQQLIADFQWLQAMDMLSLAVCCTDPPFKRYPPLKLDIKRRRDEEVTVKPWPFTVDRIVLQVPFRRVSAKRYANEDELRALWSATPIEQFAVSVQRDTI